MDKCNECLNHRLVVSENGYHAVCCLSSRKTIECMTNRKSHFITIKKNEDDSN